MDILFLLIPLSVLLALAVMAVLAWAVWSGQFEELEPESERILVSEPAGPLNPAGSAAAVLSVDSAAASLIQINTPMASHLHTQSSLPQKRVHL